MEEIELSSEDALFLSYLDQETEAKSFPYLVQAQKQEYLKGHEEVRLLRVRMTVIRAEGKGEERAGIKAGE